MRTVPSCLYSFERILNSKLVGTPFFLTGKVQFQGNTRGSLRWLKKSLKEVCFILRWLNFHRAYECRPRNFKYWEKISKSNSQGIIPKFWYPRNQRNSLSQFKILEIKKSPTQKSYNDILSRNSSLLYCSPLNFWRWRFYKNSHSFLNLTFMKISEFYSDFLINLYMY